MGKPKNITQATANSNEKNKISMLKDKIIPPIEIKTFSIDKEAMSTADLLSFYIMDTEKKLDYEENNESLMDSASMLIKEE